MMQTEKELRNEIENIIEPYKKLVEWLSANSLVSMPVGVVKGWREGTDTVVNRLLALMEPQVCKCQRCVHDYKSVEVTGGDSL